MTEVRCCAQWGSGEARMRSTSKVQAICPSKPGGALAMYAIARYSGTFTALFELNPMTGSDPKLHGGAQMPSAETIDLEQVAQLVQALERDLELAQEGTGNIDTLRAEVEALRRALRTHTGDDEPVRARLHGVREAFEETDTALFKGAQYLSDIGRMLGM